MSTAAQDLKDIICDDSSLAYEFGTDIFIGIQPDQPAECITLMDSGGYFTTVMDASRYEYPTIQIIARATTYDVAMNNAIALIDFLHPQKGVSVNGNYITNILVDGGPVYLNTDAKNRVNVLININLQRR